MTAENPIAARVESLERQNRRLRALCVSALALACLGPLLAANQADRGEGGGRTLEVAEVRIKGRDGRVLASLGTREAGTGLHLFDAQGRPCATFSVSGDGPALGLNDPDGRSATLSATRQSIGLAVTHANDEIAAALGVMPVGADLVLRDDKGKVLFHTPDRRAPNR